MVRPELLYGQACAAVKSVDGLGTVHVKICVSSFKQLYR